MHPITRELSGPPNEALQRRADRIRRQLETHEGREVSACEALACARLVLAADALLLVEGTDAEELLRLIVDELHIVAAPERPRRGALVDGQTPFLARAALEAAEAGDQYQLGRCLLQLQIACEGHAARGRRPVAGGMAGARVRHGSPEDLHKRNVRWVREVGKLVSAGKSERSACSKIARQEGCDASTVRKAIKKVRN